MILIMTAQVLFFNTFSKKDPHFNAVEPFLDGLVLLVIWYNHYELRSCTLKY